MEPASANGDGRRRAAPRPADHVGSADLVLAGGGVKGIAHVGAIEVLEDAGYTRFERVAGTSVGAIVGALVAAGMPAARIAEELMAFEFKRLRDPSPLDRLWAFGKPASLLLEHGIYEGCELRRWLHDLLKSLGAETFGKLRGRVEERVGHKQSRRCSPFTVFATDVTRARLVRFPDDYRQYGREPDCEMVADAVRASLSIPLYFEPVKLGDSLLVDGGVLSNYAVDAFDVDDPADACWPTIGVTLLSAATDPVLGRDLVRSVFPGLRYLPRRLTGFLEDLIGAAVVGQDFHTLSRRGVGERTIQVDANDYGIVDFDIDADGKQALIESGRIAARRFLRTWKGIDGRAGAPVFPLPMPPGRPAAGKPAASRRASATRPAVR